MAARKNTVADALALIEINNGWQHFVQPHLRSQLWDLLDMTDVDDLCKTGRMYRISAEGQPILETSPLWAAHKRMLAMGYERDRGSNPIRPRKATKGYIPYRKLNEETMRYDTAWISATGRKPVIFISRPIRDGGTYRLEV